MKGIIGYVLFAAGIFLATNIAANKDANALIAILCFMSIILGLDWIIEAKIRKAVAEVKKDPENR